MANYYRGSKIAEINTKSATVPAKRSGVYRGVKFSGESNERSKMRDGVYRGVKW